MKLRIITVGSPKLTYAQAGWQEYFKRLSHFHSLEHIALTNKHADNAVKFQEAAAGSFMVVLEITGQPWSSQALATFLDKRQMTGQTVSFVIGGPNGLPAVVRNQADQRWSLSALTLPHDLAMVVTLEALYRASTINAGLPYHK